MPESALAARLLTLESFRRELRKATLRSVIDQFPMVTPSETIFAGDVDTNYLLECASILAHSSRGDCQDAAFRIAHFALARQGASTGQRNAAAIVLDVLTNRPALNLAMQREMVAPNFLDNVPPPLLLDALRREVEFTVADPAGGAFATLNRFQMKVYRNIEQAGWISVSAPTSSGKSFILERAVRDAILSRQARYVLYIVPTRALIQEVELDFREKLADITPMPAITSVPRLPAQKSEVPVVFVLTQERLHLLLIEERAFIPDLLIVDEAQKISDGARGVLLEQVIDEVIRRTAAARVVFASPMTSNPDILLEHKPASAEPAVVNSEQVAVNQNLIWVSQVKGKPKNWMMELCGPDETSELGTFPLSHTPSPATKRLPFVAAALGRTGGNIVYVNGAADAEDVARLLADHFRDRESDSELDALADLAQRVIHRKYALAETVPFGVAFHYGNMPLIIRSEIERLFRAGKLTHLVCTSTLVEGVNLPARSIFVRGPQKGVGKPMKEIDFWNLAGRAGRQGKEFQGNIICVDPRNPAVWKTPPPREKRRYVIERSTVNVLNRRSEELVEYVKKGTPRSTRRAYDELESAFVYLLGEQLRYGSLARSPKLQSIDPGIVASLQNACASAYAGVELPAEFLDRNPGVSPLAQQTLLEYFRQKEDIEEVVPVDPTSDDALENYIRIITNTSKYLSGDPIQLSYPRALLVIHWMQGYPLARLIADAWDYWKRKEKKLSTVIRSTLAEIEEFVRFRFAKYSSCYVDVLRFHLGQVNQGDLITGIPPLNIWLEFGTSITTQLSLIGLGLSRTSAIELSKIIADENLQMNAALQRLREIDLEGTNLSPIIVTEVRRVLASQVG